MSDKPTALTPRSLLVMAIVDAINVYQSDPVFSRHIEDRTQFTRAGLAAPDYERYAL